MTLLALDVESAETALRLAITSRNELKKLYDRGEAASSQMNKLDAAMEAAKFDVERAGTLYRLYDSIKDINAPPDATGNSSSDSKGHGTESASGTAAPVSGSAKQAPDPLRQPGENQELSNICQRLLCRVTAVRTLQYSYDYQSAGTLHASADFSGDGATFRVNRRDISEPHWSFESSFDGENFRSKKIGENEPVFRVISGNARALYAIETPETVLYQWLRCSEDEFRWDTIQDAQLWQQRFADATYVGQRREGTRVLEVVDFPQRGGIELPCYFRVSFAPELDYLPIRFERRTSDSGNDCSKVEVTSHKTFDIDGRSVTLPIQIRSEETGADGVSRAQKRTITIDEASLKINEDIPANVYEINADAFPAAEIHS